MERRLAAVFLTDMVGFSRLMALDEEATIRRQKDHREQLIDPQIASHGGKIIKTTGDGVMVLFASVVDAVRCAVEVQNAVKESEAEISSACRIQYRIGINLGDIVLEGGDIFGDGVNVAARLEGLAHPGGICISGNVHDQLVGKTGLEFDDDGEQILKNIARPVHIWQWRAGQTRQTSEAFEHTQSPVGAGALHHFPARMTGLIGRDREIGAITDLILRPDTRLVTLTGPGGSGKTRLSERVAANVASSFADGLWFVDLAPIADPDLVASTIAEKLSLQEVASRPVLESLKNFLKRKRTLLVLDNFEQILPAAEVITDLLGACPDLHVLATSRAMLRLTGEYEVPIPPLTLPDLSSGQSGNGAKAYESEAVWLFEERARAARPGLELTADARRAIAEICVRLDGLPLAIELAAARVRMLTPPEILSRLNRRLPTLTGGPRDLPARQRTLRNTIAWSYDLLDADEQHFFANLTVFVGGFSADAAETILGQFGDYDAFVCLESLLEKSLIQRQSVTDGTRFYLLQTVREFALEKFEKSAIAEDIHRSHAEYFLNLAETCNAELQGARQAERGAELTIELDNIRGALMWALHEKGDAELGARLAAAPWWFWQVRGHLKEGRQWGDEALKDIASLSSRAQAGLFRSQANLAFVQGDYDYARGMATDARALFEQLGMPSDARWVSGLEAISIQYQGDVQRALAMLKDILADSRATSDDWQAAWTLRNLGRIAHDLEEEEQAIRYLEESLRLTRAIGDTRGIALSLHYLGVVIVNSQPKQAHEYLGESICLFRTIGDRRGLAWALHYLAAALIAFSDIAEAQAAEFESLILRTELGDKRGIAECLEGHAIVLTQLMQAETAIRIFAAAAALRQSISAPGAPADQQRVERSLNAARSKLVEAAAQRLWDEGASASLEDTIGQLERCH